MNMTIFHRRRAERFAQLLDEANGKPRHHARSRVDARLAELVAVGHQARTLRPNVELDPEFRTGLRAMLVATAEREGIGQTAPAEPDVETRPTQLSGRPSRLRARGAVIIGVAVGAVAVSGMSAASENAIPGDALYSVKRSTERAQLALASSDVTRGQLYLDFAHTRMAEAAAVRRDQKGFDAVLDDMDADTQQGVRLLTTSAVARRDPAALDAIDSFVTVQRLDLGGLLGQVSPDSRVRALESLGVLDAVTKRAEALRPALSCGGSASFGSDRLGPTPVQCTATTGQAGTERGDTTVKDRPSVVEAPTHRRTETTGARPASPRTDSSTGGSDSTRRQPASRAADPDPSVVPAQPPAAVTVPPQNPDLPWDQDPYQDFTPSSPPQDDDGMLDEVGRLLGDLLG